MSELPVANGDGSVLLTFDRIAERDLDRLDPAVPLTAALVVLWWQGRCLLVFNRFCRVWELPVGMLDDGESPRAAAFRELAEESGQRPDDLDLAGVARCMVAPDGQPEFLAIYRGGVASPLPFVPNDEMSRSTWWNPGDELPDLLPIDAALALLCPVAFSPSETPGPRRMTRRAARSAARCRSAPR